MAETTTRRRRKVAPVEKADVPEKTGTPIVGRVAVAQVDDLLGHVMWELGRAYYAYVGLAERILVDTGLDHLIRPGMGHILFALYEEDNRTIKEIAARSQLAGSTLTGLLSRMEKVKLVERSRDEIDGRLVRVRLTPLARKLEPKCRAMVGQMSDVFRQGLGDKHLPQAKIILQRLTQSLRKEEQRLAKSQLNSNV